MSTGKGGSTSQVTGYKYFMAVHFGLGRGPINTLLEVRVGDLPAWSEGLSTTDFFEINQPNLFGGDQKEGGIDGTAKLLLGAADQVVDSIITDNIEGDFPVPGWRGVSTVFYYGLISANNPYPKPWKFKVHRSTAGWDTPVWHSELAVIPMTSAPQTFLTINTQPHSGDSLIVAGTEIFFFTVVEGDPAYNVTIGSDAEETAGNLAEQLNSFSDDFGDVTVTSNGLTLTLVFPAAQTVSPGGGSFTTISSVGGGINAMNPAHIIYECVTNNVWGRGLPTTFIDETSFLAAATTLFTEGFGICMRWNRQDDIDRFVSLILQHIGGALFINRQNGLVTLKLLRQDYDPDSLPIFTFDNGLLDITEDDSSSNDTVFNEIIVKYTDPISGQVGSLRTQNLASFQALGTLISNSVDYLGLPTAALAARVSQRDLQINSGDIRRFKIKIDRVGWYISPGDVFKISVPTRGIESMVLRAGAIEDGPLEDETISITAMQDIFALPESSFVTPQPSYWTPPDRSVRVISERLVDEATYFDLAENLPASELSVVTTDSGTIKVFAEQPSSAVTDYIVATKSSLETDYVERTVAGFDAGAELTTLLGLHATAVTVESFSGSSLLTSVPVPALIVDGDEQEYVDVTSIDLETGDLTIARGCIDTIPHTFASGKIWFQTHMPTSDFVIRSTGEIADVKLLSRTSSEKLSQSLAPTDVIEIGARQGRPYPPGNLTINGIAFEESQTVEFDIEFVWAHRDRITQGNFIVDHTSGSTGPEVGTTYNVRVYNGVTLLRTVSAIAADNWTYTAAMWATDGSLVPLRFEIESERDGLVSWQKYDFTTNVLVLADLTAAGSSSVDFVGRTASIGSFVVSGTATATFESEVSSDATLASSGTSSVSFVGSSILQSSLSASGTATASFVSAVISASVLSSSGASTATFVGDSLVSDGDQYMLPGEDDWIDEGTIGDIQ